MRLFGVFWLIIGLNSCVTKQPALMNEATTSVNKEQISSFSIPILFSKNDLEYTLNNLIDGTIFDTKITEDNLQITVTKVDAIQIEIKDATIFYRVPLHIWVKKELLVGGIAAEGDIALDFKTNYKLNSDWTISIQTHIKDYHWIKTPKAQVLGFRIPVTSIAERILNASSKNVTDAIDKQVNENLALKDYATQAWELLQNPILISADYDSRFKFTPTGLSIAPFKTEKDTIVSTLFIKGKTEVGVGQTMEFSKDTPLLPLKIEDFDRDNAISINIQSKIPFHEAEKLAIKNFKGEPFSFGKRKITIQDIQLSYQNKVLEIRAKTAGDYSGWLLLKGFPSYNKKKNQIEIQDIEFSLDTKNILLKSAKWLFNGLITNKLEGKLIYPLDEDLTILKKKHTRTIRKLYNFRRRFFKRHY